MICVARFWHIVHVYHKKDNRRVRNSIIGFSSELLVFVIESAKEQFPGCSFLKIDGIDSLTVTLL